MIWGIDLVAFRRSPESAFDLFYVPRHLYEGGPGALARYVLALDTLRLSLRALLGIGHRDLESLNRWGDDAEFGYAKVRTAWHQRMKSNHRRPGGAGRRREAAEGARHRVGQHLVNVVRANPEIEFDLFFPPYSVLAHLGDLHASRAEFEERVEFKRAVVSLLAPFDNARVFDFQQARELTHDFRNYKDLHHYAPEVNDYIITAIAEGRHEIDKHDYERSLREFIRTSDRDGHRCRARARACP